MTLLLKHLHVFRELLFSLIPGWVNNTACKHNDESVTHASPWHHTGRNAEGGHLMSLLLIAAYDGATRWQWRDTTVPHCSVVQPSVLKAVTQRQKWGLGQDASCYFHSLALSLSPSLLGNSQKQSQTHWNLAHTFIFLLALAQPLVCQKGMQTERKSLAEQVHLFIPPLLSASGPKTGPQSGIRLLASVRVTVKWANLTSGATAVCKKMVI